MGAPLTSADVKFTFDSILSGPVKTPKRGAFELVQSVEAPDACHRDFSSERAVRFVSLEPDQARHRNRAERLGQRTWRSIPSAPGHFVSSSMTQDEEIVLERNPDYFGGAPKIERVRFRIVPDAIVRALELRKGTADLAFNSLSPDTVLTLEKAAGPRDRRTAGNQLAYIAFNFDDPILAHREVRQALAYATDRESLIQYLLRGQARLASSLLPPNHWAYEPNVRQYDYDPARAQQLLDAAGFRPGADGVRFHLTLKTSTDESTRLLAEALADQWKRVGVALELRPLEFATFYSDITHGSFQLYTFRWVGASTTIPIFSITCSIRRKCRRRAPIAAITTIPSWMRLLEQQRVEMDREKRKAHSFADSENRGGG